MGQRALVAYERPDEAYNLHYAHRGALRRHRRVDVADYPTNWFGLQYDEQTTIQ